MGWELLAGTSVVELTAAVRSVTRNPACQDFIVPRRASRLREEWQRRNGSHLGRMEQ